MRVKATSGIATYLELVHAERNMERGAAKREIKVLIEKTGEDAEANTKNELVRGNTDYYQA
jgi:hypothetical protein